MLDSFFNSIFGWAIDLSPLGGLIIITFILTLIITIIYKLATNQKILKEMKEEMKQIRKEMKDFRNDPQKMMSLQKRSMEQSFKQMKMTIKPMLISFIPLLIIFSWLKEEYKDVTLNFIGIHSWIWIYLIFAILSSIILRKILRVH